MAGDGTWEYPDNSHLTEDPWNKRLREGGLLPPKPAPKPKAGLTQQFSTDPSREAAYANGAMASELQKLGTAPEGERNLALFNAAANLRVFIRLGSLPEALVTGALTQTAQSIGLGDVEIDKTIASAYRKDDAEGTRRDIVIPDGWQAGDAFQIDAPADGATDDFWSERTVLGHIRQYAQSRLAGPWGALGSVLVRAMCAVPPHVTLPPTTGGAMSLNMFAALVGPSGMGKNASDAVARECIRFSYGGLMSYPDELPIGTGEGVAKSFRQAGADEDDDRPRTVIFTAPEVDTLTVLGGRQGATLDAELRKTYSGEQLGFANAQKLTRSRVAAHDYRMGLITGAQPLRCGALLDAADGGTPQRFIWMPVDDPGAPDVAPDTPAPLTVDVSAPLTTGEHLHVPAAVRDEILTHRRAMLRGERVDPLNGHRLLTRLKVAAALMILDSPSRDDRGVITEDDWRLAGVVMDVSDHTRGAIERAVAQQNRSANKARAEDAAEREVVKAVRLDESSEGRAAKRIVGKLQRMGRPCTHKELRDACSNLRDHHYPALEGLLTSGDVVQLPDSEGGAKMYDLP